jgi:hypothetical protein
MANDVEALRIAVYNLFQQLSPEQQEAIKKQIMFSVNKHDLEGVNERRAVDILNYGG